MEVEPKHLVACYLHPGAQPVPDQLHRERLGTPANARIADRIGGWIDLPLER
jgi:hypothetical protein